MAGLPDDFNEDDFEDYNSHPYLGGYDIAKTYGAPLPPSIDICYPVSSSPVHEPALPSERSPVSETPIVPLVEQSRFEPYEYGDTYNPEPYKPDLFRSFSNSDYYTCKGIRGEVRDHDYWNQFMKGLDFLFGHSHGFGERRVGSDIYGIPIYANKRNCTESVLVKVEQPSVHKLEHYEGSNENWPLKYEEIKEENGYAYNRYNSGYYRDYYDDEHHNSNYSHAYQEWGYKNAGSSYYAQEESREENNLIHTPVYSYNQHYYEQPLNIQMDPNESTWTQNLISHEGEEKHGNSYQSYERSYQPNEQYRYESLEPFNPSCSQNLGYNHDYFEGEPIASDHYHSMYNVEGNEHSQHEYTQDSVYYEQNQTWSNDHVNNGDDFSGKSN